MGTRETAWSTQRNISTHQQLQTSSEMEYLLGIFQSPSPTKWSHYTYRLQWGWRDKVAVRSPGCSSRGPRLKFQNPYGGSEPSVTPIPGNLMPLFWVPVGTRHVHTDRWSILTHKNKQIKLRKLISKQVRKVINLQNEYVSLNPEIPNTKFF